MLYNKIIDFPLSTFIFGQGGFWFITPPPRYDVKVRLSRLVGVRLARCESWMWWLPVYGAGQRPHLRNSTLSSRSRRSVRGDGHGRHRPPANMPTPHSANPTPSSHVILYVSSLLTILLFKTYLYFTFSHL